MTLAWVLLLLLLLLEGATAATATTAPLSFRARFSRAVRLQHHGRAAAALALYAELITEKPSCSAALSNYAVALQGLGRDAEAIVAYRRAVEGNPTGPRLRINLALALEKTGSPNAALAELDAARRMLLQRELEGPNADPEAFASCLSNAASIASSYQLWPRHEIERAYLSALALVPRHAEAQQNLLLFQRQADFAGKRPSGTVTSATATATTMAAACCLRSMRNALCQTLGELAASVQVEKMSCAAIAQCGNNNDGGGDSDNDVSDTKDDDFARPKYDDVMIARRLACGDTDETADSIAQQPGPVVQHVRRALNCSTCAASREGRILQTVVDALQHREDPVSAADAILRLFNVQKDLPWHMSLSGEKRMHLREVVLEATTARLAQAGPRSTISRPHKHVEIGAYLGLSAIAVASMPGHINVLSIERNPIFAAYARTMVHELGEIPTSRVSIQVGDLHRVRVEGPIDSVLLDHWKDAYLSDLQRLQPQFAQTTGAVVVADNTVVPGVPDAYLRFVRARATRSYQIDTWLEQSLETVRDAMEVSWFPGVARGVGVGAKINLQ